MTYLENSITKDFTIGHAKQTLENILDNINVEINNPNSDLDKKDLDGIHRYLSNAISNIEVAQDYFK